MALKFDHAVKYNGKYYPANTPIEEVKPEPVQEPMQEDAEAIVSVEEAQPEEEVEAKPEPAKKAVKGRKKGDA